MRAFNIQWFESALNGAFVVDAPGTPANDRIFALGAWFRDADVLNWLDEIKPQIARGAQHD